MPPSIGRPSHCNKRYDTQQLERVDSFLSAGVWLPERLLYPGTFPPGGAVASLVGRRTVALDEITRPLPTTQVLSRSYPVSSLPEWSILERVPIAIPDR
jgi:hypothetical protein